MKKTIRLSAALLGLLLALGLAATPALAVRLSTPAASRPPVGLSMGGLMGGGSGVPLPTESELMTDDQGVQWALADTLEKIESWAGEYPQLRLTADVVLDGEDCQVFAVSSAEDGTPASVTLDMNGHTIRLTNGATLGFGGAENAPVILLGDGGTDGLFQVEAGCELYLGDCDASAVDGLVAVQAEGSWLVLEQLALADENGSVAFAQAPVLDVLGRAGERSFYLAEGDMDPAALEAALPVPKGNVNYRGVNYRNVDLTGVVSWGCAAHGDEIAAKTRLALSAQAVGPLADADVPTDAVPMIFHPIAMDVAFLVDGAAITTVEVDAYPGPSWSYEVCFVYPDTVTPTGLDQACAAAAPSLQVSFDDGVTWRDLQADSAALQQEGFDPWSIRSDSVRIDDTVERSFLLRVRVEYHTEAGELAYHLYTDSLRLSPQGAKSAPEIEGTRGGAVDLLPTGLPGQTLPSFEQDTGSRDDDDDDDDDDDRNVSVPQGTEGGTADLQPPADVPLAELPEIPPETASETPPAPVADRQTPVETGFAEGGRLTGETLTAAEPEPPAPESPAAEVPTEDIPTGETELPQEVPQASGPAAVSGETEADGPGLSPGGQIALGGAFVGGLLIAAVLWRRKPGGKH